MAVDGGAEIAAQRPGRQRDVGDHRQAGLHPAQGVHQLVRRGGVVGGGPAAGVHSGDHARVPVVEVGRVGAGVLYYRWTWGGTGAFYGATSGQGYLTY